MFGLEFIKINLKNLILVLKKKIIIMYFMFKGIYIKSNFEK